MSILDGARRHGWHHVVLPPRVEGAVVLSRAVTFGARHATRWAFLPHADRRRLAASTLRAQCRVSARGIARYVDAVSGLVVVEFPDGVTLERILAFSTQHRAKLPGALAFRLAIAALDAAIAPRDLSAERRRSRAPLPPPHIAAESLVVGFDGTICSLAFVPCWPAPNHHPHLEWLTFHRLLRRIAAVADVDMSWLLTFTPEWRRPDIRAWIATRIALAEVLERDHNDHDDAFRTAGLVRALFPSEWARSRALSEELATVSDHVLRSLPFAGGEAPDDERQRRASRRCR